MAKDVIIVEKPQFHPVYLHAREHLKINVLLQKMKDELRNVSTVEGALELLFEKHGRDYVLFIRTAVKEIFQLRFDDMKKVDLYLRKRFMEDF